uniref:Uncharacterized protein n=1 Tax=Anguilla anguilla TaxID=7936 RepID=A0A0E9Q4P7_ANGAN
MVPIYWNNLSPNGSVELFNRLSTCRR